MSEPVLALTQKAMRAIIELRAEFAERFKMRKLMHLPPGVLTPLSEEYERRLKAIVREGLSTDEVGRDIRIECPDCKRQATVASDVLRWKCVCSPHVVRYSFQTLRGGLT